MTTSTIPNCPYLFVPATRAEFVRKAMTIGLGAVILDLEDSIPQSEKLDAREMIFTQAELLREANITVCVRVNSDLRNCALDIEAAIKCRAEVIFVPKTRGAVQIQLIDECISHYCNGVGNGYLTHAPTIVPMLETFDAFENIAEIVSASPRISGLAMGAEDLCSELGIVPNQQNLFPFCQRISFFARKHGLTSIAMPGPISNIKGEDRFISDVKLAKQTGCDTVFCVHPKQVDMAVTVFAVSEAEIERAQIIVAAYAQAIQNGQAVAYVDGSMIDAPVAEQAQQILARHLARKKK